jgi:tetratricopeptide (TPR) repeat protein
MARRGLAGGVAVAAAAAGLGAFVYWLVHGFADWFWEFPLLGGAAFAFLGLAAGLGRQHAAAAAPLPRPARAALLGVGTVILLAGLTSYAAPWLSAREVDRASSQWRQERDEAFERLDRARRLNPLSDRADLVAGAIAMRLEEFPRARAAFERTLTRNPYNWYAYLELAMIEALAGNRAAGLARIAAAEALNPTEPTLEIVHGWIAKRERVDPRAIDDLLLDRVESRTGVDVGRGQ